MSFLTARYDRTIVFLLLSLAATSARLHAEDLVFEIDPFRTELQSSIFITPLGISAVPQEPNADITTYRGTITVRVDDSADPGSIRFLGADALASVNGAWLPQVGGGDIGEPGTPMPANYGMVADDGAGGLILVAIRNTNFVISSEAATPVVDGVFGIASCTNDAPDPMCQRFDTTAGTYDFNISSPNALGDLADFQDFEEDPVDAINQEGIGEYEVGEDGVVTLTIPLLLEYNNDLADFFFAGVLVATHGVPMEIPGDANGDGRVDAADLNVVGINWQMGNKTRAEGDFTGDGFVDAADLNILGINWLTGVPPAAAVPEPSTCSLLMLAMLMGLCRRRGKQ